MAYSELNNIKVQESTSFCWYWRKVSNTWWRIWSTVHKKDKL